ncbi:MAG: GNAT family N-acetyltransferase [Pseudobdellovibrio sp.]
MSHTLSTNRLLLKIVTLNDIPSYKKYFINYSIIEHLSSAVPWPYPDNGVEQFLQHYLNKPKNDEWLWGLFLKSNPTELIGVIHLWKVGRPENRGFWLAEPFWKLGLMTEAAVAVNEYAFNTLGFEKLIFANALGNIKSRKIKEKTGAAFLRTEPAKFVNPKYTEHEVWELTKEKWTKFN